MICGVKEELRTAGNRAEFANFESIVIAFGIVVQNIVPLEIPGIIHKIVVHRVVADFNRWICNNILKIYR